MFAHTDAPLAAMLGREVATEVMLRDDPSAFPELLEELKFVVGRKESFAIAVFALKVLPDNLVFCKRF